MTTHSKIKLWAAVTAVLSLLMGAAAIVWADFGMPTWFFFLTQIWFWTLGLPAMLGVLGVTAVWDIPGWTALPLWLYVPCAVTAATACHYGSFLALNLLWRRIVRRHS